MTKIDNLIEEQSSEYLRESPAKIVRQLRRTSTVISWLVICLGCSVILGWLADWNLLKSVIPNRVAMPVSTALGLILGGISLLLYQQRQQKNSIITPALYFINSLAIALSAIVFLDSWFDLDLLTSWLFFVNPDSAIGWKMSPNTAVSFLCFNTAMLLLLSRSYWIAQLLVIFTAAIASVGSIGHIYGIGSFYRIDSSIGMAIHTAIGLILLTLAFLGTCSNKGWMRTITRSEAGGILARWLLPLVVITPPSLGGIFWVLFQGNTDYLGQIVALRIILEMLFFGTIVWWTARQLNYSDRQKQKYYQQLLDSEQRFKAIFDQTFQFTGLLKPDGTLLEANQTALDFGGISKSDVVNKPFWTAYWWQISPQTQADLQKAIALARTGKFIRYPVKVQGKGDRVITIDFSLRPVKDQTGEVILLIPEGRDISEKVAAERALEETKAKYQAIVEEQAEFICRYRQDATVSYVNHAFCRYFGIERSQIIDREYTPVVYHADRTKVARLIDTMTPENPTVTVENRVIAKGVVRWTQWNNRMIFDRDGNFIEYQSVGRDITPLKEIELKLRESEEKFRRAFEDAATGEALVAPDGTFIRVNRSLCEIVGYEKAELIGKTFQQITHPKDLDLDLNYVRQMLAGKIRTYQMEKRYLHKRGDVVWVLLNVSIVRDIDGEPMYFISQIQDISQRKRAEAKLNDLVKDLERSNQELDEFASVVSHDLISPLHKQLLIVDLLQEEYGDLLGEAGGNYCEQIIGYNSRMENLVRSLLTYARVTTTVQSFVLVDLNEIVEGVLYDLKLEIAQTEAKIEVGQLPIIKGDRLQLNQLFLNLLQNALKFYSRQRIPQIKIEYYLENNDRYIRVSDNGIGFEPEQQTKIFTPFHRLHSQSKYKGTGLGLAICEKIVERHQGKIVARSQSDRGAVFTICFPAKQER